MMRRGWAACALVLPALSGCASTALGTYVGGDLAAVVHRYGPPRSHAALPDGMEAFDWVITADRSPAASAPPDTFLPVATAPIRKRERADSAGLLMGGMCVYTVLARWEQPARRWRVVGYRTPRIDCN